MKRLKRLSALLAVFCLTLALLPGRASASHPFTDVPDGAWYGEAVEYVYQNGLMDGTGDGEFSPDVPDGEWYTDAVAWAGGNKIVEGYDTGDFGPDDPITREQMVTILRRYAEYKGYDVTVVSAMNTMCEPSGILFLADGTFLVTDTYNKVIWQVDSDSSTVYLGPSSVYAGGDTVADPFDRPIGGYNDAELEKTYFKSPWAIVPFLDGSAVSDADNNAVRLVRSEVTQTVNGSTKEDLTVTDLGVAFDHPTGLAVDGAGNLYVSDTANGAVRQIKDGEVTTLAIRDMDDLASFIPTSPVGLAVQGDKLYVCDSFSRKVFVISPV